MQVVHFELYKKNGCMEVLVEQRTYINGRFLILPARGRPGVRQVTREEFFSVPLNHTFRRM